MRGVPPAELDVDASLVARLLRSQAPQLASLPLHSPLDGWDNRTWRLGNQLAVRLPRREAASGLLLHEQLWLPRIAPGLPLPVPDPVVLGVAEGDFPWAWSVVPWFDGDVAARHRVHSDQATALGLFLAALHQPAPPEAPENPYRGVPLSARTSSLDVWRAADHSAADADLVRHAAALVEETERDQPAGDERRWLHGDLHPRNVLVHDGRLAAILDWGDLCAGDVATDLASAWWLFEVERHTDVWSAYGGLDETTWHRARAWAALFGLMFLHFSTVDDPARADAEAAELGRTMLHRALARQHA